MNNKLIPIVITLVVGIILAGSVLMPVLNDATKTTSTFDNVADSLGHVATITDETDYTFSWTPGTQTITVDGEEVSLYANETVICKSGETMVRYTNGYFQCWNPTLTTIGGPAQAFTLAINDGVMTITGDDIATITEDVSGGYILANDGDYVMKASTQAAYMLADSPIVAMGVTTMTGNINTAISITGTASEVEVSKIFPTTTDFTFTDVEISKTAVSSYKDLYKLDKITFVATDEDNNTTNCTYSYFIVPAKVTAELSQHLTPGQIALMGAIPVLVIVALLVVAVGVVARRNE